MSHPPLAVKVSADMACFTRPENKVERVSYAVPTPSAARGVLEAIFWKPEFTYRVREIVVLKPILYISFLRNEVSQKATGESISITDARQQRNTLALHDVSYIIRADIETRPHATTTVDGYREQFRRRVEKGQCFHRPYLGCREFAADFAVPDGNEAPDESLRDQTFDFGFMLFDIAFREDAANKAMTFSRHGGKTVNASGVEVRERRAARGFALPTFFEAKLVDGVLTVPPEGYERMGASA